MNRKDAASTVLKSYTDLLCRALEADKDLIADFLEGYYQLRRILEEPAPVELPLQAPPGAKPQDFAPVQPPTPSRGTAAAKFKRDVRERLEALRKKNVSLRRIVDASGGAVSESEVLDVLQCAKVDYSVYKELDAAMKSFPED